MLTQTYTVNNISCAHCTHTIESELKVLNGVQSVKAEQNTKQVTVVVESPDTLKTVESTLVEIGYPGAK